MPSHDQIRPSATMSPTGLSLRAGLLEGSRSVPPRGRAGRAQAAYYSDQALQETQARGRPNYYVGLLRALATDRAAMAQRLRTGIERRDERPRSG